MHFNEYQKEAAGTNIVKDEFKLIHAVLGLAGEAGEVCEKFKKMYRDKQGVIDNDFRKAVAGELGDVSWFLADVCTQLGLDFDYVVTSNLEKLRSRRERGTIQGNGDNR